MNELFQIIVSDIENFKSQRDSASAMGSAILDKVSQSKYDGVFGYPPFFLVGENEEPLGHVGEDGEFTPLPYGLTFEDLDIGEFDAVFSLLCTGVGILRFVPAAATFELPLWSLDDAFESRVGNLCDEYWELAEAKTSDVSEQMKIMVFAALGRVLARSFDQIKGSIENAEVEVPEEIDADELLLAMLAESPLTLVLMILGAFDEVVNKVRGQVAEELENETDDDSDEDLESDA